MSQREHKSRTNTWLIIGVVVLIVLLFVWLTVADLFGDTDVAAFVTTPVSSLLSLGPLP